MENYSLSQNRNPILPAPSGREPDTFLAEEGGPLAVEGVFKMQSAKCKTPQSASLTAPLSGRAAEELWDLRSAILSDLVGADIKSDAAGIFHL